MSLKYEPFSEPLHISACTGKNGRITPGAVARVEGASEGTVFSLRSEEEETSEKTYLKAKASIWP